jgi:cytoskeletal protein CcmA (bactofilin family)
MLAAAAVVCVSVLATAVPAHAQSGRDDGDHGRRISVTGGLVVAAGESADGTVRVDGRVNGAVYVGRGDLTVAGRVSGDALVLDGDATITGRVDGDITVLNGRVTVKPGADVRGDVTSGTSPRVARGTVRGHVRELDLASLFTGFIVVLLLLLWVAVTLSIAVMGLVFVALFPRATDAVVVAGRRVGASLLWGLLVGILGPILGVGVLTSVVGIPLGIAVLGTLALLGPLGYVGSAVIVGRSIVRGNGSGARIGAFFAGFGILRFAALVPGLGFLVGFVFTVYGIGALTIAGWRAAHREPGAPGASEEMAQLSAPPPSPPVFTAPPPAPVATAPTTRPRKAPARKARTKKKAPTKKRATRAKTSGAKKSSATRSRRSPAKKTGTRKSSAKRRPTRAKTSGAKRSSKSARRAPRRR